ncbi:hypothetical protein D3C78_1889060 [compost metagenome]
MKLDLLKEEIRQAKQNREILVSGNNVINNYSRYNVLIKLLLGETKPEDSNLKKAIENFDKSTKAE